MTDRLPGWVQGDGPRRQRMDDKPTWPVNQLTATPIGGSPKLQLEIEQRRRLCEALAKRTKDIDRAVLIAILTSILPTDQLKRLVEHQNKY